MSRVSMATLKNVAIIGGVAALAGASYISWRIPANFTREPYYQKSIELLNGYPPAVALLGEPIRTRQLDLGDTEKTFSDGLTARLAIPLTGRKQRGTLHCWASRKDSSESWTVDKLDIEVRNRLWTFYIDPNKKDTIRPTSDVINNSLGSNSVITADRVLQQCDDDNQAYLKYINLK